MKNLIKVKLNVDDKVIIETLERIGVANLKEKTLYPSCYLYYIENEPYIVHFKQLFLILRNDSYNNISDDDLQRRNSIIFCLKNWNLIEVDEKDITPHNKYIFVLSHKDKSNWKIKHKFNIQLL